MNPGKFETSKQCCLSLLKKLDYLKLKGYKVLNNDGVSDEFKKVSQETNYFETYRVGMQNFDFDLLLKDESFFQFECEFTSETHGIPAIRYAFYQNPYEFITYEIYLEKEGLKLEDAGEDFVGYYEQHIAEKQINLSSTVIRYDVHVGDYKPLVHAVSHLHIGHENNVRIPVDKLLTPLAFVLFVLKHIYYYNWERWINANNQDLITAMDKNKEECEHLPSTHWVEKERKEFYLT